MKKDDFIIPKQSVSTAPTDGENPIHQFDRIKHEIDLIEKDIKFYQNNVYINL
jgi:hypothetical protein